MAPRRTNPNLIKKNRNYTVDELAIQLEVRKNTVRQWQRNGLTSIDRGRPTLFLGTAVRAYLTERKAGRKRPCPPGTIYCFRCRQPRPPALDMVDYVELRPGTGNLHALCGTCDALMCRRVRGAALESVMPGIKVQIWEALPRLKGRPFPSLNCDLERRYTA